MAVFWETVAYIFRALGAKDQQSSGTATVTQILVLVAPICEFLGLNETEYFSPTCLQGLMYIGLREGFIVLFLGLVAEFYQNQLQAERAGRLALNKVAGWRWMTWALYTCALAITVRIIYRLSEFSAGLGSSNPLPKNEPLLYVLESTPMFLVILIWNILHPGRYRHGEDAKMPRSWLSRHLCCCCHRFRFRKCNTDTGHIEAHHRLRNDVEMEGNQGTQPIKQARKCGAAVFTNPFLGAFTRHSPRLRP